MLLVLVRADLGCRQGLLRAKQKKKHKDPNKPWFLESSLSWASKPECRILMFDVVFEAPIVGADFLG